MKRGTWGNEIPLDGGLDTSTYCLGIKFTVSVNTPVYGMRVRNQGLRTLASRSMYLWADSTKVITKALPTLLTAGRNDYFFDAPYTCIPGVTYTLGYDVAGQSGQNDYFALGGGLASSIDVLVPGGSLEMVVNGGVYATPNTAGSASIPNTSYSGSYYGIEPLWDDGKTTVPWVRSAELRAQADGSVFASIGFGFTAVAGRLLVAVVSSTSLLTFGPQTWTQLGTAPVSTTALYVIYRIADGTEINLETTASINGVPRSGVIYEFPAGTIMGSSVASSAINNATPVLPNLTGLTGTNVVFGAIGGGTNQVVAPGWTVLGTPAGNTMDARVCEYAPGTVQGAFLDVYYQDGYTAASYQPSGTANQWIGTTAVGITFSVKLPAGPIPTPRASAVSSTFIGNGGYTSPEFKPNDNSLLVVAVCGQRNISPPPLTALTIDAINSGGASLGLVWTLRRRIATLSGAVSTTNFDEVSSIYTAPVTTGVLTRIVVDCGTDDMYAWVVGITDFTGFDSANPVGVGTAEVLAGTDGPQSITLSGAPAATSVVWGFRYLNDSGGPPLALEGVGHIELSDVGLNDTMSLQTQFRPEGSTSTAFSWQDVATGSGSSGNGTGLAIEIKAGGGGTPPPAGDTAFRQTGLVKMMQGGTQRKVYQTASTGPTLPFTDFGKFKLPNFNGTMVLPCTGISPAAGQTLVLMVGQQCRNDFTTADFRAVITDDIGDTNPGPWVRAPGRCSRGPLNGGSGLYVASNEIWTRRVGTTPGANKTVTITGLIGAGTTTGDGSMWANVLAVTGTTLAAAGTHPAETGVSAGGLTIHPMTLLSIPKADSMVISFMQNYWNNDGPMVPPTGFTQLQQDYGAGIGEAFATAYDLNNAGAIHAWTGLVTGDKYIGTCVEILLTTYGDHFNRSDTTAISNAGTGLGAGWDSNGWFINNNAAHRGSTGTDFANFQQNLGSPDHWVECDIRGWSSYYCVLNARRPSAVSTNENGYLAYIPPGGSNVEIGKTVNGTYTTLINQAIAQGASSADYRARLEVQGNQIRFYRDAVLICSITDNTFSTGNFVGLNGNSNPADFDNFACGALNPAYVDNFNRADVNPLAAPWIGTTVDSYGQFKIVGNVIVPASVNVGCCNLYDVSLGADHWVEADIVIPTDTPLTTSSSLGLCVRSSQTAQYYVWFFRDLGTIGIYRHEAGNVYNAVGSTAAVTGSSGRMRMEAQGTALRVYWNGALLISATDSVLSGTRVGFLANYNTTGIPTLDNFACGSFAPIKTVPTIIATTINGGAITSVNKPAGGALGDHYIIDVINSDRSATDPGLGVTGFLPLGPAQSHTHSTGATWWTQTFYKAYTGTEGTTFDATGLGGQWCYLNCYLVRGSNPAAAVIGTLGTVINTGNLTVPGVTVAAAPSLAIIHTGDYNGGAFTDPATWTLITSGTFNSAMAWRKDVAAGAVGDVTLTRITTTRAMGQMIAYPPA